MSKIITNTDGRLKETELSGRGSPKDAVGASLAISLSDSQPRREKLPLCSERSKGSTQGKVTSPTLYVPVVGNDGVPLMPCHPARARELVRKGKAKRRFKAGIFYIRLTQRAGGAKQDIAVGIDPGSKREAFTVKSESHTYLNILSDAVTWVKDAVEIKRMMRRARRNRKTPCRQNRENRARGSLPPSTKARWQAKLRIVNILVKLFPITDFVVEDIKAKTMQGKRKWNASFSPLEHGKQWFYGELGKLGKVHLKQGFETKELRDTYGLKKTHGKMEEKFSAHNVDSWVLANWLIGGHTKPDNESVFRLIPLRFHRRQLHAFQAEKGNFKRLYGSTMSQGMKRGSIVQHKKHGLCYLGGSMEHVGLSLHKMIDGKRLCQNAKSKDMSMLGFNKWRWYQVA